MEDDVIIKVNDLNKDFILPHEKTGSVKSAFVNFYRRNKSYEYQHALADVSFEVKRGEFFGIIGRNGSGKSTLLKTLAGIYVPTSGGLEVRGKLTPFIELGVGFNPELTGRENVYLNGSLLGFNRKEMRAMYKDIVEFAELEKFMDQKLKNYSSGMQVRLAFSIAIRAQSDILLIDEVLAVGDENFQRKCFEIFEKLKREGRTIVFVTHDMGSVRDFCDRAILINKGKLLLEGEVEPVIAKYHELNRQNEEQRLISENTGKLKAADKDIRSVISNKSVEVLECKTFDHNDKETFNLEAGKKFKINIKVKFHKSISHPVYGIMLRKDPKMNLLGINSFFADKKAPVQDKGSVAKVEASFTMRLAPGTYYLTIAIADQMKRTSHTDLLVLNNFLKVNVYGRVNVWGLVLNDGQIKVL